MADESGKRNFSFDNDKLRNLEKSLYARDEKTVDSSADSATSFSSPAETPPADWADEPPTRYTFPASKHFMNRALMKKILLGTGGFFGICLIVGALFFFGGWNKVSTDNVVISVNGPSSIGAGEPLSFEFVIHNQNNIDLASVNLLVEYPPGTRTADDQQKELLRESEQADGIPAGDTIRRTKQAMLFGEADSTQHIIVSVEYRVKDSSATYFKEFYYDLLISTAPVRLSIDTVKEAFSGKDVELSADVVSNATSVVSGLMLRVDYPYGFTYTSSSPAPVYGNNIFLLGDLNPADHRVIRIHGTIEGQEGEERNFRFNLGLPDKQDSKVIGTTFLSSTQSITVTRPFVSAILSLGGSTKDPYVIPAGQPIDAQVAWSNNLPDRIVDLQIQAKLSGDSLNRLSVSTNGGFYRSVDNTIVWDKSTVNSFSVIEPAENGGVSFSFSSLPVSTLLVSGSKTNELSLDISVKARRLSDSNVPEEIISSATRKIRLASNLNVAQRSLYFTGPFQNQGPIPPKADRNTTYTVVWTITNTLNSVSDARVEAVLPLYITWLGNISPSSESVTFDPLSRKIVWDAGDIPAGTGFNSSSHEVAFQVSLVASLSQVNTSPALVGPAVITGTDRFTSTLLKNNAGAVKTNIEDSGNRGSNVSNVEQ